MARSRNYRLDKHKRTRANAQECGKAGRKSGNGRTDEGGGGAAALHNQIPRQCTRMRSAPLLASRREGESSPRARETSEKCSSPPSYSYRMVDPGHKRDSSMGVPPARLSPLGDGIPGINRKPTHAHSVRAREPMNPRGDGRRDDYGLAPRAIQMELVYT